MTWFKQFYFRWCDKELDRTITHPNRDDVTDGEWNAYVGELGERLATKALWRTGKKVLFRNFRPVKGGGEIDIVYRDRNTLVFGEVKTRTRGQFGDPSRAVDKAKQELIIRGANAWLGELYDPQIVFRFDIIEVLLPDGALPDIRINEDAFTTPQVGLGM